MGVKMFKGTVKASGSISNKVIRNYNSQSILSMLSTTNPFERNIPKEVCQWRRKNIFRIFIPLSKITLIKLFSKFLPIMYAYGTLYIKVIKSNGEIVNYGVGSLKVVTNNGVAFIVDAFQNLVELENMKFHGIGTGAVAEASADSALGTELTTQYSTDNTRATGTTTENGANIYRTVGTNTVDAAVAITEHGILSQAATGGGVLLDRSVFSVINLANGDSLQSTYDLTISAGG